MVKAKKIKENRWRASVYMGKNEYGKKIYKDIYGTTEKECNSKVIDFIYKKENGLLENTLLEKTNLKTVEEFYDDWIENRIDLKEISKKEYRSIKKCHLSPLLKLELKKLNSSILKKFYKDLFEKTNANTTRRVARLFNCFLHSMMLDARVKLNKDILDNIRLPKVQKRKHYYLKKDEYKNILSELKKEYDNDSNIGYMYILLLLCGSCGFRISEALALFITDVDLEKGIITLNKEETQVKGKGYYILESTKTEAGDRIVVIPKSINELLKRHITLIKLKYTKALQFNINTTNNFLYIDKTKKEYILPGNKLLIQNQKFGMIPKNTAQRAWKTFREGLGYMEQLRIHDFRRFSATLLMKNDIPDEIAKLQLGHSSSDMTRYYQNIDTETLIEYIKNIDIDI